MQNDHDSSKVAVIISSSVGSGEYYTIALMTNNSSTYYWIAVLLMVVVVVIIIFVVRCTKKAKTSFSFTETKFCEGELIQESDSTLDTTNPLYGDEN